MPGFPKAVPRRKSVALDKLYRNESYTSTAHSSRGLVEPPTGRLPACIDSSAGVPVRALSLRAVKWTSLSGNNKSGMSAQYVFNAPCRSMIERASSVLAGIVALAAPPEAVRIRQLTTSNIASLYSVRAGPFADLTPFDAVLCCCCCCERRVKEWPGCGVRRSAGLRSCLRLLPNSRFSGEHPSWLRGVFGAGAGALPLSGEFSS